MSIKVINSQVIAEDSLQELSQGVGNFIVGGGSQWTVESGADARSSLGLGSAAVEDDTRYLHRANNLSDVTDTISARNNLEAGHRGIAEQAGALAWALKATRPSGDTVNVTVDRIPLFDSIGNCRVFTDVDVTIDRTTTGENGLDAALDVNGIEFDGTNDYLVNSGGLTGLSDGKEGTVSFWINLKTTGAFQQVFGTATNNRFRVTVDSSEIIRVIGRNASNTTILDVSSSEALSGNAWRHCIISWDLVAGTAHMYLDHIDVTTSNTLTNDTIDYTDGDFGVGARGDGTNKINAAIEHLWFDDQFIDISDYQTRQKFVRGHRNSQASPPARPWAPADLGSSGENPTGASPVLFLSGDVSSWETNLGTGGDFTVNGSPTAPSDSPDTLRLFLHYHVIAKQNGVVAGLFSQSKTAPTLPSGYIYWGWCGSILNQTTFRDFIQRGGDINYAQWTMLEDGEDTNYAEVDMVPRVPPDAIAVKLQYVMINDGGGSGGVSLTLSPNPTLGQMSAGASSTTVVQFAESGDAIRGITDYILLTDAQTLAYRVAEDGAADTRLNELNLRGVQLW